jgi:dolichol-phosphate mannosyltransferase
LALLAMIAYLVRYQASWPPGFATLVMLMLISLAMNAIFLGIIGEYLARVYRQVKPGPLTIVDRYIDRGPGERATAAGGSRMVAGIVLPKKESTGEFAPNRASDSD